MGPVPIAGNDFRDRNIVSGDRWGFFAFRGARPGAVRNGTVCVRQRVGNRRD